MGRERSVFEAVDAIDGEDEGDSDLDIIRQTENALDLTQYIDDAATVASGGSSSERVGHKGRKRVWERMRDHEAQGVKVEWSDSDDAEAAYKAFKNRKSIKRKKAAAELKRTKAVAARREKKSGDGMVGKDAASRMAKDKPKTHLKRDTYRTDSSDEEQLLDEELPDYLKARKMRFDKIHERLGEAGLKVPPRYDDIDFSDDERLATLCEKPVLPTMRPVAPYEDISLPYSAGTIPAPIAQWLRKYQVDGASQLHEWFVYQRGGLLADDMGLGKTIQVIAFLTAAFGKTGDERDKKRMRKQRQSGSNVWYPRVLIVCPASLMNNWKRELELWGWWDALIYHGIPEHKREVLATAGNGRVEIVITTYDTYRNSKSAINTIDWDCVIADECQKIKEHRSEITRAMNGVNALCRIGLTGTAIQNKYEELFTLLNWTNPGRFGNLSSWKRCISEPLKLGQAHTATTNQLGTARKVAKQLAFRLLSQFFIRRLKSLIADQLPKKRDNVVFCPLTETQSEAYMLFVESEVVQLVRNSADPCDCGSGKTRGCCCHMLLEDGSNWKVHVFPVLNTLGKLANHLASLIPSGNDSDKKRLRDLEVLKTCLPDDWKDIYRDRDSKLHCANQEYCGKWKVLKKLLSFWYNTPSDSGPNKVLVFSYSVRLLRMLQDLLRSKTSYNVSYFDGSMKLDERQKAVDDFNSDPEQFVFLISTRAGGVGLNITSANKVVIFDPSWNPSHDLQAQDRAYRIGQTRDVDVFRLVSVGTIEEVVYARQIYKQQQANIGYTASLERRYFRGVQDRKENKGEIFGLKNMLAYEHENLVMRDIVNKTNIAEVKADVLVTSVDMGSSSADYSDYNSDDEQGAGSMGKDAVLSQLAEMIKSNMSLEDQDLDKKLGGARKKKMDPIRAILSSAGVTYTHENSEVIGSSRTEARLSRRAIERGNDIDAIEEHVFSASQSQRDNNLGTNNGPSIDADEADKVSWKYRPAEDVRTRQFCSMAKWCGFENVTDFALVVEGWTQAQRRNCLDKFYSSRRAVLFPKSVGASDQRSSDDEEL